MLHLDRRRDEADPSRVGLHLPDPLHPLQARQVVRRGRDRPRLPVHDPQPLPARLQVPRLLGEAAGELLQLPLRCLDLLLEEPGLLPEPPPVLLGVRLARAVAGALAEARLVPGRLPQQAIQENRQARRGQPRYLADPGLEVGKGRIQALAEQQARDRLGLPEQIEEDVQVAVEQVQDRPPVLVGEAHPLGQAPRGGIGGAAALGEPVAQREREADGRRARPQV
ncbi:MAG: hypothetical protein HYY54_06195, partial [candidate division NC10 bacterium]|nr:hypothetical protein [candidate division NC10 bacterium]